MNKRLFPIIMFSVVAGVVLLLTAFTGGGKQKHGPMKSENRAITSYSGVRAGSVFEIDYTPSASPEITIEAPEDVLPEIETTVRNGVLELNLKSSVSNLDQHIRVHLKGTNLTSIDLSGASSFKTLAQVNADIFQFQTSGAAQLTLDLKAQKVSCDASGASQIILSGSAGDCKLDLSGATQLDADKFVTTNSDLDVSGASHAHINVTKSMTGDISGASSVIYSGKPASHKVDVSGVSSIKEG